MFKFCKYKKAISYKAIVAGAKGIRVVSYIEMGKVIFLLY